MPGKWQVSSLIPSRNFHKNELVQLNEPGGEFSLLYFVDYFEIEEDSFIELLDPNTGTRCVVNSRRVVKIRQEEEEEEEDLL